MDSRVKKLIEIASCKNILHLGCADMPYTLERIENNSILHLYLMKYARKLIGIDVDFDSLEIMKRKYRDYKFYQPSEIPEKDLMDIEVVIAGEVIEHILDLQQFGLELQKYCKYGAILVITTPNAYSLKACIRAILGREVQHPDHISLFTTETLINCMNRLGFQLLDSGYYNNPPRKLISKFPGWVINSILKIAPRASDGLIFTFNLRKEKLNTD